MNKDPGSLGECGFATPENVQSAQYHKFRGPNGWLLFVACNSGMEFAQRVKEGYEASLKEAGSKQSAVPLVGTREQPLTRVFTDTETCPRLPIHVAGSDAYLFQCVHSRAASASVNENIQQLIQAVRVLRAHRAQSITVVLPYIPYSRQDKPSFMKREPTSASLFADQLKVAGADALLTYHPHTFSLYGFYEPDMKFVPLNGLDLFAEIFRDKRSREDVVVVSTDAGGAKFTVHYADRMGVTYAIANKVRGGKGQSNLIGIIGAMEGKRIAIVTDDETVTGESVLNTIRMLRENHGIEEIYSAVSHFKVDKEALGRFVEAHEKHGLRELHVTDSIPHPPGFLDLDFLFVHSLARSFAAVINRLHANLSTSAGFAECLRRSLVPHERSGR